LVISMPWRGLIINLGQLTGGYMMGDLSLTL
jgi:hypothetical protein